jgi:hypothetical protein
MAPTPKQITIRNPSPALTRRLRALSRSTGESLNKTILRVLEQALGVDARRDRLRREADWSDEDVARFEEALSAQRTVDEALWR